MALCSVRGGRERVGEGQFVTAMCSSGDVGRRQKASRQEREAAKVKAGVVGYAVHHHDTSLAPLGAPSSPPATKRSNQDWSPPSDSMI